MRHSIYDDVTQNALDVGLLIHIVLPRTSHENGSGIYSDFHFSVVTDIKRVVGKDRTLEKILRVDRWIILNAGGQRGQLVDFWAHTVLGSRLHMSYRRMMRGKGHLACVQRW